MFVLFNGAELRKETQDLTICQPWNVVDEKFCNLLVKLDHHKMYLIQLYKPNKTEHSIPQRFLCSASSITI